MQKEIESVTSFKKTDLENTQNTDETIPNRQASFSKSN